MLPNYIQKLNSWYYSSESTFNKIAFLGDINYYPNELALDRLINKILPMLTESSPDLILSVIGNISNNKLKQLQHHKNVNFLGYVDNLENALMKIDALIFPLEIVSGIQNKFLTALTYGIPCVATPQYIFHENLSDENQLLIANTDIEFAEKIIRVLQQKDLRERLSLKSREFSQTYLSQEFVEKTFVSDILDNLAF
ncbi:MAG: glycosyltransferase [Methylacidiphilales bacterium]|nr:glycosyltransferase [Candidatus Methylacidiphilales bacterium]